MDNTRSTSSAGIQAPISHHGNPHSIDSGVRCLRAQTIDPGDLLILDEKALMALSKTHRNLTQKIVSAAAPQHVEYTIWSTSLKGFGLRVRPSGQASFILIYRPRGRRKQRRYTIGSREALSLKQALDIGRNMLAEVLAGRDPSEKKKLSRTTTVQTAFQEYIRKHLPKRSQGYSSAIQRAFRARILPRIGDKALLEVVRADIRRITDELLAEDSSVHAINIHRMASAFFSWCTEEDLIPVNPLYRTRLPAPRDFRDYVIEIPSLVEIWRRCEDLAPHWRAAIRLLMLTGLRKSEVLNAAWDEIDFERGVWVIPRERSKNRISHSVPLTPKIIEIFRGLRISEGFVFKSPMKPSKPVYGISYAIEKLRKLVRARGWRLHDIRRSVATHMAALKVPPHIIEKVLNHRSGEISGVAAIYNRHGYDEEKREALQKWQESLTAAINKLPDLGKPCTPDLPTPTDDGICL